MEDRNKRFTIRFGGVEFPRPDPSSNDFILSDDATQLPDQLVSDPESERQAITRRILRPEFIWTNPKDSTALIKATLMHQRRGAKHGQQRERWQDADSFNLATLKADEQVRLALNSGA